MRQVVKTMRRGKGAVRGLVSGVVLVAVLASLMCLGALSQPAQAADFGAASEFQLTVAGPADSYLMGHAVAIDGDTAIVGAPYEDVGANGDQGAAYIFVRSGTTWTEQAQLTGASVAPAGDYFGYSVAISGDTAVVGALGANKAVSDVPYGAVFVFVRSGTTWTQQAELTPSDQGNYGLGYSVAISGDTVVVGTPYNHLGDQEYPPINYGAAFIFVRSGTTWTQQAKVFGDDVDGRCFGISVAIDGDTVVAGDMDESAWVFTRSGTAWGQKAELNASDGAAGDFFGRSVAISGDTVVVGAAHHGVAIDITHTVYQGAAYVFTRSETTWTQQAQLAVAGHGGAADDNFGNSVAVSGDTAVVGAYLDDVGANADQGSAWVFTRSGTTWTQQAQITASDGSAGDHFGNSVAIDGDTALAGAPYDDVGDNPDQGSAYVFVTSGIDWSQQAQLTVASPADSYLMGQSVAIDGDTAIVGAPYDDVGANGDQGAAYIFVRSGTTWTEQAQLTGASVAPAGDYFGYSVAISGDTAVVGALGANKAVSDVPYGAVFVFVRSGTTWTQQAELTPSDQGNYGLGYSVAISGDTVVVGTPYNHLGDQEYPPINYGAAFIFVRSGTTWTQQAKVFGDDVDGRCFGISVAIDGDTVVAGDMDESAWVFTRSGTAWGQKAELNASDGTAGDFFGISVAISGDTAVVGAYLDDVGGNVDQGSAYVFTRSGTTWSQQAQLTAGDGAADDSFGNSVAISGDTVVVGAYVDDVGANADQGSACVFTRSGTTWTEQAEFTASDGAAGDNFGNSVAIDGDTALAGAPYDGVGDNPDQGSAYVYEAAPDGNQAPVAADDSYWTEVNASLIVPPPGVLANDTDADGDPLTAILVSDASNGTLISNADGSFTYTPEADFEGTDTFTYTVSDGMGGTDEATVSIEVNSAIDSGTISGVVTDAVSGDPVPMIYVTVYDSDIYPVAVDVTDPSGYYEVGNLEPGLYIIQFLDGTNQYKEEWYHNAPMYDSAQQVLVTSGGVTTADEDLVPWGRIGGTVTDASSGGPLAGITVEVRDQSNTWQGQSTTDADGRYTVGHLESGTYKVYFYDDSQTYAHEWYHDALIFESATTVDVTIGEEMTVNEDLWVGSTIQGTVTDASSGNPIPNGISVWVFDLDHAFAGFAQVNGGQYEVKALRPGSYRIYFQDDLGTTYISEWYHDAAGYASFDDALPVTLATPGETITVDEDLAELVHLGRIAGTVTDASTGLPISGAEVTVYDIDGNSKGTASTGSDGRYITLGLDDGLYKVFFQDPYGYHCTEWFHDSPGFDQATPLEVTSGSTTAGDEDLVLGGKVEGTVTDASTGLPIEGIGVYVTDSDGNLAGIGYTDGSGMYSVKTPPGSYRIRFADDYARYGGEYYWEKADLASSDEIQVTGGTTTTLNNEQLSGEVLLGTISGVVTDAVSGDPVPMIFVTVYDSDIYPVAFDVTDPAGYYEVGNLEPGLYLVWFEIGSVQANQYKEEWYHNAPMYDSAQQVLVTSGGVTTADEDLVPWGRIGGTVTDASSGGPLAGITVEVRDQSNTWQGQSTTDADGRYTVGHLESGTYKVYFYDDSQTYAHEWYHNALIFESATTVDVTIGEEMTVNEDLWVGSTIQGTVTDASSGNPIPSGISVWVFDLDHAFAGFAQVNGGQYEVKALRPGSYRIYFQDDLGTTYISEWYHDAAGYASFDDALPVTLATPGETITVDEDLEKFINTVTAFVSGGHGSVDPSSQTVEHGDSATIYIYPDIGYHVSSITDNGDSVPVSSPYVITGVTRNHEISVTFAIDSFTVDATAGPGGAITPSGAVVVNNGANQAFAIIPDTGYHIADVLVDGVSVGAVDSYTFYSVTAGHTIVATFAIDTFTVTATADPAEGGSVTGAGTYNYGQTVNLSVTASEGCHFVNWTEDGQEVSTEAAYSFTATADRTLLAHFAINTFTITATAGAGGSITPSGDVVVNYGADQSFSISADTGYHIADVLVDGVSVGAVTSYAFDEVTGDHVISVSFAQDQYTLGVSVAGNGSVAKDPDQATYTYGTVVTLTATADPGWVFTGWSGDLSGSTNPAAIAMDGNKAVTATFAMVERVNTVTWVFSSANPSVYGQQVTFVALVLPRAWGSGMPTGVVEFKDGETTIGTGTLNSWGLATCTTTSLSVGKHSITAVYGGDSNFNGSTSPALSQKANKAKTTVKVISSANPSISGQSVTFTATVAASEPGSGTPTGMVTFKDGSRILGTGTLNALGQATYTTSSLSVGTHPITAVYGGDGNYGGSTSSALSQKVNWT